MTGTDEDHLKKNLNFSVATAPENVNLVKRYTVRSREEFARKTRSMVLYLPDEVRRIKQLEEEAVLKAAPKGYELKLLNGLNIGCGDRRVKECITPVDIMREGLYGQESGEHNAFLENAILANPEDLPFKESSLDYIIALHMLEHVSNPMQILDYWGSLLKPGGGIGLILPNHEYTWDAREDTSLFGHKWNTNAPTFRKLFTQDLSERLILEDIDSLPFKISFDVVLRKPGTFEPFRLSNKTSMHSGAELARMGSMVSEYVD
jgi:SAM-dependent methyltransferase